MMTDTDWVTIPEFPNYEINAAGEIYNTKQRMLMHSSLTNHGHTKITLTADDGSRHTRSVALLVAQSFCPQLRRDFDHLIVLNGDFTDTRASNLAWRPRHFAWKYTHQLKVPQPLHYHNLEVLNLTAGIYYQSIIQGGMSCGLLFADIWRSTWTGHSVFPDHSVWEVVTRV